MEFFARFPVVFKMNFQDWAVLRVDENYFVVFGLGRYSMEIFFVGFGVISIGIFRFQVGSGTTSHLD